MLKIWYKKSDKKLLLSTSVVPKVRHKQAKHAVNVHEWKHFTGCCLGCTTPCLNIMNSVLGICMHTAYKPK
jgi:hypothetical protein